MEKVVITTNHRGVFFGTMEDDRGDVVVLTDARNCISWSETTHGFLGLASIGPQPGSKIGPAVPRLTLSGVTSIALCTEAASALWESEPWA